MCCLFFLMIRQPPTSKRNDTPFPSTTLFRSRREREARLELVFAGDHQGVGKVQPGGTHLQPHIAWAERRQRQVFEAQALGSAPGLAHHRSEEHTSELQSLMRISSAVFCLKKKKKRTTTYY